MKNYPIFRSPEFLLLEQEAQDINERLGDSAESGNAGKLYNCLKEIDRRQKEIKQELCAGEENL